MYRDDEDDTGVFTIPGDQRLTPEERARTIAGRYEIIERIGEGGMGQVTLVRHRRLGKKFALKLMQAELSVAQEAREMFHREARLASALSHPNVVSIVDFGEDPDWGLFLVMEFLEGDLLSARIGEQERIPIEICCDVAAQLAQALDAIHRSKIVHGDLKTDNVVCLATGGSDDRWQVKLLDFGMARLATVAGEREHTIAGTPEYMAPERIQGQPPNPSNDLYALGIILYEMLTGAPPFTDEDPRQILERHLTDAAPHVGAARGEVLDERLIAIVERAISKDPAARYPSGAELARDIRDYMDEIGMRQSEIVRRQSSNRSDAAAAAFEGLAIPAAGISTNGTLLVVNKALAKVLQCDDPAQVEGKNIQASVLGRLLPSLREDVRLVSMTGKMVRRRVTVTRPDGRRHDLRVVMTPTSGPGGSCVLALHALSSSR